MADDELENLISELKENAENERVELLTEIIERQQKQHRAKDEEIAKLRRRLTRAEAGIGLAVEGLDEDYDPYFDARDRSVLKVLVDQQPAKVTVSKIRSLYREVTDVRNKQTLRNRTKFLLENGPFERVKGKQREFEFLGVTGDGTAEA